MLSTDARIALTLRLLRSDHRRDRRAFLVFEPTIAQRIVRAKRTLSEKNVPFEFRRGRLASRLASVLAVVYLIFNEGYQPPPATTGCGRSFARKRSASAGILAELAREERRSMDLLPSWRSRRRASAHSDRPVGRAGAAARSEPRALGSSARSPRSCRARARGGAPPRPSTCQVPTHCRPQSRPVTRVRLELRTRTGHVSSASMALLPRSPHRPLSTSIVRWRWRCCWAGGWPRSRRCVTAEPALKTDHSCRACVATSSARPARRGPRKFERVSSLYASQRERNVLSRSRRFVCAGIIGSYRSSRVRLGGSPKLRYRRGRTGSIEVKPWRSPRRAPAGGLAQELPGALQAACDEYCL